MATLDKAVIIRYERGGKRLEVLADPDLAMEFRKGKNVGIDEVLVTVEVFRDARKGERASLKDIKEILGLEDMEKAAVEVLRRGELHLTTEQRRRMVEEKRLKIATIISQRAINPQTNTPHPTERILRAMEEAKVSIDPLKSAEEQLDNVIKAIRKVLPIKIETRKVEVVIPPQWVGKAYGKLKGFNVIREEYGSDGSLRMVMEIPAGVMDDLIKKVADITKGEGDVRMVEK